MFVMMAVVSGRRRMGMVKVRAKRNFERKVAMVDSQMSFVVFWGSDSSEMWMPRASERASAMAMVRMPPMTARREWVPE